MAAGFTTVVAIRPADKLIEFYDCAGGDIESIALSKKSYRSRLFDEEFFVELRTILETYMEEHPSMAGQAASVVFCIPDFYIATDILSFPVMGKKSMGNLFDVAIEQRYKNHDYLQIKQNMVMQNKQYSMVALSSMRQSLLRDLNAACAETNMTVTFISTSGNFSVVGAAALDAKLQGESYVLLDIEDAFSELSYVARGIVLGTMQLPYGLDLLQQGKVIADNMFFDHSVAELAVLNAKEKAKAKQLTMAGADNTAGEVSLEGGAEAAPADEEASFSFVEANNVDRPTNTTVKSLPKKQPRALPKWMMRPAPENEQQLVYENFRSFEKAIFEFIAGNSSFVNACPPEFVVVNIPKEYGYLIDMTNEAKEENKYELVALEPSEEREIITHHLSLYGGLFAESLPVLNAF